MTVKIDLEDGDTRYESLSKGINIEGVARQKDLNKLAERVEGALFSFTPKPTALQEDFDELAERVKALENSIIELEVDFLREVKTIKNMLADQKGN